MKTTKESAPAALGMNVLDYAEPGAVTLTAPQRDDVRREVAALKQRISDLKLALGDNAGWFDRARAAESERDVLAARLREVERELGDVKMHAKAIADAADRMHEHEKRQDEMLGAALREKDALRAEVARLRELMREVRMYALGTDCSTRNLIERVDALLAGQPVAECRGCGKPLLPENYRIADGCPCNSPRGVNHGLVPTATCTCAECDPEQTGSTRYPPPAEAPIENRGATDQSRGVDSAENRGVASPPAEAPSERPSNTTISCDSNDISQNCTRPSNTPPGGGSDEPGISDGPVAPADIPRMQAKGQHLHVQPSSPDEPGIDLDGDGCICDLSCVHVTKIGCGCGCPLHGAPASGTSSPATPDECERVAWEFIDAWDWDVRDEFTPRDKGHLALAALLRARDVATWNAAIEAAAEVADDGNRVNPSVRVRRIRALADTAKGGG